MNALFIGGPSPTRQVSFVQGPKGELERTFPDAVTVKEEDGNFVFTRMDQGKKGKAMHGLARYAAPGKRDVSVNGHLIASASRKDRTTCKCSHTS